MNENAPHSHEHVPVNYNTAFTIGIGLNIAYLLAEAIIGWRYNSLALLSDAGHNLSDVGSLLLAWGAFALQRKQASSKHTYGLGKATILTALTNGIVLMIAIGALMYESIGRLVHIEEVSSPIAVIATASFGIFINGITAFLFMRGGKEDLNIRGAFLHMAADAAVSGGVVVAGIVIWFTGAHWIDSIASLLICVVVGFSSWGLLKSSLHLSLDGVPENVDVEAVEAFLRSQAGVKDVHDLHIWALSTSQVALTGHIVCENPAIDDALIARIASTLKSEFNIAHTTLQLEHSVTHTDCALHINPTEEPHDH
jgi:cobalt-zinc-cadmium efflux system protein